MPAIVTEDLTMRFRRHVAVDRVSLSVPEGSVYALLGPNGAGKTTTVRLLLGLLEATAGSASVLGRSVSRFSPAAFQQIGYVAESQRLPLNQSVDRLLRYLASWYPTWDAAFAEELLDRFQIQRERKIRHLSRGTRVKLQLVAAVAFRPKLLVVDELFSGLDPVVRMDLVDGLLAMAGRDGWTLFVTTHELTEIEPLVDHVAFLYEGRLLLEETIDDLLGRHRVVEASVPAALDSTAELPAQWTTVRTGAGRLRFVDTQYEPGAAEALLRAVAPQATEIDVRPATLRDIFIASVELGARTEQAVGV